jgi:hypothetical protein
VPQENETELVRLISTRADPNQASWDDLTPLCAAGSWPKGVKILLEAGARRGAGTSNV